MSDLIITTSDATITVSLSNDTTAAVSLLPLDSTLTPIRFPLLQQGSSESLGLCPLHQLHQLQPLQHHHHLPT